MSLINKMLDDLDSRGLEGHAGVSIARRRAHGSGSATRMPSSTVATAIAVLVICVVAAAAGWWLYTRPQVVAVPAAMAASPSIQPASLVKVAPAPASVPAVQEPPLAVEPMAPAPGTQPMLAMLAPPVLDIPARERAPKPRPAAMPSKPRALEAEDKVREDGIEVVPPQVRRAEPDSPYAAAMALIRDGRVNDAAIRLEEALSLDARQPAMAMALARIQFERGEIAVAEATLRRSMQATPVGAEYNAFLAALLQRQGQHSGAVEQYHVALRLSPERSIWWMGLAISLEAMGNKAEAVEAYKRARSAGLPTRELAAFVDQKMASLR